MWSQGAVRFSASGGRCRNAVRCCDARTWRRDLACAAVLRRAEPRGKNCRHSPGSGGHPPLVIAGALMRRQSAGLMVSHANSCGCTRSCCLVLCSVSAVVNAACLRCAQMYYMYLGMCTVNDRCCCCLSGSRICFYCCCVMLAAFCIFASVTCLSHERVEVSCD